MFLSVEHKKDLIKLKNLSLSSLKSVLENLKSFNIESDENEDYYHSLLKLSIESQKLKLSERDIFQILKELSFDDEQINEIVKYIQDQNDIFISNSLRFVDLEWRLEAKIASRSIHNIDNMIEPKILLKMNVDKENSFRYRSKIPSNQQIIMQTDATNLIHIILKLEQALLDSKTLVRK